MRVTEAWTVTKKKTPKTKKLRFYLRAQKFTDHKTLLSQCVGLCFKNSKSKAFILQHENKTETHKAKLKIFLLLCLTNWGSWYRQRGAGPSFLPEHTHLLLQSPSSQTRSISPPSPSASSSLPPCLPPAMTLPSFFQFFFCKWDFCTHITQKPVKFNMNISLDQCFSNCRFNHLCTIKLTYWVLIGNF